MWVDAYQYVPENLKFVIVFQMPQRWMLYQDAYLLAYRDDEGIWRSSTHRPLNVLFWRNVEDFTSLVSPPYPYYFDGKNGWMMHN